MAGRHDYTSMGGGRAAFPSTHWTQIRRTQAPEASDDAGDALGDLLSRYWRPVYCYLRRRGHTNEEAKDLTQGFLHDVVLGRDLVGRADRAKGRFRTYLLHALQGYVVSMHRHSRRKKRHPAGGVISLDGIESAESHVPPAEATPEAAFTYMWARCVLDQALTDVEAKCRACGRDTHWRLFQAKVLDPIVADAKPPGMAELAERHGVESAKKATNMILTVRRWLQAAMREQVRSQVDAEHEIDTEIGELMEALSQPDPQSVDADQERPV